MARIERLNKPKLVGYCANIGIGIKRKSKGILIAEAQKHEDNQIQGAIEAGKGYELRNEKMKSLAEEYAVNLNSKIADRKEEMKADDNSHYLIYKMVRKTHRSLVGGMQTPPMIGKEQ